MGILITIKPVRLNGELLEPGAMIRVVDGHELIKKGYARRLTPEETRTILDSYVEFATKVFSRPQHYPAQMPRKPTRTHAVQENLCFENCTKSEHR